MTGNYDLDRAYTIDGPEEARRLYAEWADTYDDAFRGGWGYVAAREIAGIMKELQDGDTPILDIGAGTGALAEHLDGSKPTPSTSRRKCWRSPGARGCTGIA